MFFETMENGKVMLEKKELRKQIRLLKQQYSLGEKKAKSISVWETLEQDEHFQKARVVLAYWSMDDEVYTHEFVAKWSTQKTLLLPSVRGEELDIRYFEGEELLRPGEEYAIPEPVGVLFEDLKQIDLIIVPGVAFDAKGGRLGRGKGYYDKILKQTNAYKVGVCFDFQVVEQVPTEEHDIKMDLVIKSVSSDKDK